MWTDYTFIKGGKHVLVHVLIVGLKLLITKGREQVPVIRAELPGIYNFFPFISTQPNFNAPRSQLMGCVDIIPNLFIHAINEWYLN